VRSYRQRSVANFVEQCPEILVPKAINFQNETVCWYEVLLNSALQDGSMSNVHHREVVDGSGGERQTPFCIG
jgi:hypothetical protein